MGRRKLEMKRIENRSSRLVTFSKRRMGLMKKARQFSVLCDVDIAVIVFSAGGKMYDYCSGGSNSMEHILARCETESRTINGDGQDSCTKFRTCKELLETVDRLVEENNNNKNNNNEDELSLTVTDMTQLEEELYAALMQARSRKTQLMTEYVSTLQEEGRSLIREREEIVQQIASAERVFGAAAGDDVGGGLNDLSINQMYSPQHVTLPLFHT